MNYQQLMSSVHIPIYSLSVYGDKFIAPPKACKSFFNYFNNPHNQFREFSIVQGHLDNYSYSRLIKSKNARIEVWQTF